jgi:hypothetical protein
VVLEIIFFVSVRLYLVIATFPFPFSTAQFLDKFWKIGEALRAA